MRVGEAIETRRAYRFIEKTKITGEDIESLIRAAQLSPSCFNNQPWRFVFVKDEKVLGELFETLSSGNEWCRSASLIIAVYSKKDFDCDIHGREYYLFDTGIAVGQMMLKATEMGLVMHPIAGYSPKKVRTVLNIPDEMNVITLLIVGKKASEYPKEAQADEIIKEKQRPERLPAEKFSMII